MKYEELLRKILKEGYTYKDKSREVNCKQISSATIEYSLEDNKLPIVTTKYVSLHNVIGELLWFLRGDSNIKYLVDNNIHIWDKDAYNWYIKECKLHNVEPCELEKFVSFVKNREGFKNHFIPGYSDYVLGDVGRNYGVQWKDWPTYQGSYVDQIYKLIKNLKDNPMSRRHIVTAWNPDEINQTALPPCHWSFEIIVEPISVTNQSLFKKDDSLKGWTINHDRQEYQFTLKWHQRSVDTFLGLPYNLTSYSILANIIGQLTNMKPLKVIGDLSNVHIYEPHILAVEELLQRETYELPELLLEDKFYYAVDEYLKGEQTEADFNELFSYDLDIANFKLKDYKYHPAIKAEMLAPINNK